MNFATNTGISSLSNEVKHVFDVHKHARGDSRRKRGRKRGRITDTVQLSRNRI
jgi:hypothetical protein